MKEERDEIKQLKEENKRLKIALGEAMLAKHALESLIEVVDRHYQTDVKKNFEQKQLNNVERKRRKA
jgi:hypothetical protein